MRVTEEQHNPGPERPGRATLLVSVFGLLLVGLILAFSAGEPSGTSIEAVAAPESDQGDRIEFERALSLSVVRDRETTTTTRPEVGARVRVYDEDLGELEGRVEQPKQRVLAVAPVTVPAPPTTIVTTTTAVVETTDTQAESTTTTVAESGETTTSTGPGAPEATDVADSTSETTERPADGSTTITEPTTTTSAAPAPTAHPDGWVDTGNGVFVPSVLLAIRFCESTDNYTAANRYSSARGAYQFITGSWASYGHAERYGVSQAHLATPAQQDEAALLTWQRDGTRPWNASRSCWG